MACDGLLRDKVNCCIQVIVRLKQKPRPCVKLKEAEQAKTPAAVIYWAELSLASKIHAVQLLCEQ